MSLALNVPKLLRHILRCGDDFPERTAAAFRQHNDIIKPIAIERWTQRGSITTPRLLTVLQIAKDRGVRVNLLNFTIPAEQVAGFKESERAFKARKKAELDSLLVERERAIRQVRRTRRRIPRRPREEMSA